MLSSSPQVYCDTSLIIEVLEHTFSKGHPTIYPPATDTRTNRSLIRGFASYWTDVSRRLLLHPPVPDSQQQRPLFRVTTGLIPSSVWRTHFGTDRAGLIGHKLNPDKLEAKLPQNLSGLDMHLVRIAKICVPFSPAPSSTYFLTPSKVNPRTPVPIRRPLDLLHPPPLPRRPVALLPARLGPGYRRGSRDREPHQRRHQGHRHRWRLIRFQSHALPSPLQVVSSREAASRHPPLDGDPNL